MLLLLKLLLLKLLLLKLLLLKLKPLLLKLATTTTDTTTAEANRAQIKIEESSPMKKQTMPDERHQLEVLEQQPLVVLQLEQASEPSNLSLGQCK